MSKRRLTEDEREWEAEMLTTTPTYRYTAPVSRADRFLLWEARVRFHLRNLRHRAW